MTTLPSGSPNNLGPTPTQWVGLGTLLMTVLGVIANICGIINFGTGQDLPDWLPKPVPSASAAPTSAAAAAPVATQSLASTSAPTTQTQRAASQAPTAGAKLLADLSPATSSSDMSLDTDVTLHRKSYDHSLLYSCDFACTDPTGDVEYAIPAGYEKFTAVVGVTDNAQEEQTGTFEVYLDGTRVKTVRAKLGVPQTILINLGNASRLKLLAFRPGTVAGGIVGGLEAGANAAGGISNGLPSLAWADPKLTS